MEIFKCKDTGDSLHVSEASRLRGIFYLTLKDEEKIEKVFMISVDEMEQLTQKLIQFMDESSVYTKDSWVKQMTHSTKLVYGKILSRLKR